MSQQLHPSQLHQYLKMYQNTQIASWGCLIASLLLLFTTAEMKQKHLKPWVLGCATAALVVGREQRKTVRQLREVLNDVELVSKQSFLSWLKSKLQPSSTLTVTVSALSRDWQPPNLITNIVEAIAGKQVRIVAPSGVGKSTLTQYLAYMVGGSVRIYEPEGTPDDWQGLEVIGKGENWEAINLAMGEDLLDLSNQLKTRTEKGDAALIGTDRVFIGEEYPEIRQKCSNADQWLERHARRGRKGRRFLILISQFDKVAAWGLEGKSDLIDCFRCIRLGKIAIKHAESLGSEHLVEWLKHDQFGRCMIDDEPCQLPPYELMKAVSTGKVDTINAALTDTTTGVTPEELLRTLEYPEKEIVELGLKQQGEWLPAWKCHNQSRSLRNINLEDIRLIFQALASRGIGEVDGEGDRLGWRIDQIHLDNL